MSKKDKQESRYGQKVLFGVHLRHLSKQANKHNARMLGSMLRDLGIKYKKLGYVVDGEGRNAFETAYSSVDEVKKLCEKFGVGFVLACYGSKGGSVSVFKIESDSFTNKDQKGVGYLQYVDLDKAIKTNNYFCDEDGNYFCIRKDHCKFLPLTTKEAA